ncbi:MAG: hypothetical protein ABI724_08010 [Betaproteobacteria bacterium]
MLLTLALPRINEHMTTAKVTKVYVAEGDALVPGAKLVDLRVDLSAVLSHDCPPVSYYRIAMRDVARLRQLAIAPGDLLAIGAPIALFSTEAEEPMDAEPARPVRITLAGIVPPDEWWEGNAR